MKKIGFVILIFVSFDLAAQTQFGNSNVKTITSLKDSIQISEVSISPLGFAVFENKKLIDPKNYKVDYGKSILYIDSSKFSKITIHYTSYPNFLTKKYTVFDKNLIVPNSAYTSQLFRVGKSKKTNYTPFKGLNTKGSLIRGITFGNNQDAVLNSSLDLQVSGKLSEKVSLRASISDTDIPIQENGYSQKIQEFDRVFIELFTSDWSLKAGDIDFSNTETNFLKFNKKVTGLSVDLKLDNSNRKVDIKTSGALVRGIFARQEFKGIDGNQGPYKLLGPNGEPFIIILSGSETLFVNGVALKRGVQNDYTIDYSNAEIIFTTTFPITSNMRIIVEFQYSDESYTRFITYNKAIYKNDKLEVGSYFYNENDVKSQPLQQNLNKEQKDILALAGNDIDKMFSSGASVEAYDKNKILYKKIFDGSVEIFEFSQDNTEVLYAVNFIFVGENRGSYSLKNTIAIGKIYEYVGQNQGNYDAKLRLVAPTKLQVAVTNVVYKPSSKTSLDTEIAISNADENLFSKIDDNKNKGVASKIGWTQTYLDKKWLLKSTLSFDYLQENFKSIQRVYNVEFSRDWNLRSTFGNQEFINTKLFLSNKKDKDFFYNFEFLKFGESFKGNRHNFKTDLVFGKNSFDSSINILENSSLSETTTFLKSNIGLKRDFQNSQIGISVFLENNKRKDLATKKLNLSSQKFLNYNAFIRVGDSTKVYAKFGINFTTNDSVKNEKLTRVNNAKNYYIKSRLIQNKKSNLFLYLNYRNVNNVYFENSTALNSRLNYSQKLFKNFINFQTVYETSSGTFARQEFSYIRTETGKGYYTWIDYNNNQIQEFDEFEISKFTDQANYLRVALPTTNYLKTSQTKFSQSIYIDAISWNSKKGIQKLFSQFSNQSFILIDTKNQRINNKFNLNPFDNKSPSVLGLQYNFKNSLFFRRGIQKYSTTYIFSNSKIKSDLGIGFQENENRLQQIQFQHKIHFSWLFDLKISQVQTISSSENFNDRNYLIKSNEFIPTFTYIHSKRSSFSLNYIYKTKKENLNFSELKVHTLGASYQYSHSKKGAVIADANFHKNTFIGDNNSSISYQMLEGLQPGNNYVWNLVIQKKLTKFLYLNINYSGRRSNSSKTIHIGNVQVRANF